MNTPKSSDASRSTPARWRRVSAKDIAPLASLAVIAIFFAIASPSFLTPSTVVHVLKQGSVLAIVAAGLTFVLLTAEIDLSVGMVALWSACLCGWLFQTGFGLTSPDAGTIVGVDCGVDRATDRECGRIGCRFRCADRLVAAPQFHHHAGDDEYRQRPGEIPDP